MTTAGIEGQAVSLAVLLELIYAFVSVLMIVN
jgi:hypothetical protein